ncbi:MAG: L-rhamnose mutarotase [Propioniciclava sp.]
MTNEGSRHRSCFLLHLKPDRVPDYLAAHEVVWPDMIDALRAAGWANYSLFLREADGLVVGYVETEDFARAQQLVAATAVNERWQAHMATYFDNGGRNPDEGFEHLVEYFHLD